MWSCFAKCEEMLLLQCNEDSCYFAHDELKGACVCCLASVRQRAARACLRLRTGALLVGSRQNLSLG